MVRALGVGLFLSCGAWVLWVRGAEAAAQDVEELICRLKAALRERSSRYYTAEQVEELATMAGGYLGRVEDLARRAKLAHDLERFLYRRADKHTLTWVVPLPKPAGGTEVYRTPAQWELFKHELDKRVRYALRREAPKVLTPVVRKQIDRILMAVRVRLSGVFEGPGAERYLKSLLERYERYLVEDASSELEFHFVRALTEQELADLEREIAVFKPNVLPPLVKDPPPERASDPSRVWIEDAEKPPHKVSDYADMGVWSEIRSFLLQCFLPSDFLMDEKSDALYAKANQETDELVATLKALRGPLDFSKATDPVVVEREGPHRVTGVAAPKAGGHAAQAPSPTQKMGSEEPVRPERDGAWWPALLAAAILLAWATLLMGLRRSEAPGNGRVN